MTLKIAACGAGGVGKTTCMKEIAVNTGLTFWPGVSRQVFADQGVKESDQYSMSPAEAWKLQKAIFDAKIVRDQTVEEGIFDRTLADHMAYSLYRCAPAIDKSALATYKELMKISLEKHDFIFYFPLPAWDPEVDGLREDGRAYRFTIDMLIKGMLSSLRIHHFVVPDLSTERRVQSIMSIIASGPTTGRGSTS